MNSNSQANNPIQHFGKQLHQLTQQDRTKGGSVKSPKKRRANILKGYKQKKDLTERQKFYLALIEHGEFDELWNILLFELLQDPSEKTKFRIWRELTKIKLLEKGQDYYQSELLLRINQMVRIPEEY